MLRATEKAHDRVNVFNVGTAQQVSVRDIAERVVRSLGGSARIEYTGGHLGWPGDVPVQLLSVEKLIALGWNPELTSSAAVDRAIATGRAELGL